MGFVQRDQLMILIQHHGAGERRILARQGCLGADLAGFGHRRDAHDLTRLQALIALGACAVDADLAGAQEFLHPPVGDVREMRLEPAVQTHVGLGLRDFEGLNRAHDTHTVRASARPTPVASTQAISVPPPQTSASR